MSRLAESKQSRHLGSRCEQFVDRTTKTCRVFELAAELTQRWGSGHDHPFRRWTAFDSIVEDSVETFTGNYLGYTVKSLNRR